MTYQSLEKINHKGLLKMIDEIKDKLKSQINTEYLDIIDESPNHGGYSGAVSHIKIIIVSIQFDGLNLIKRHQLVYKALGSFLQKIHAISIVSKTPEQWKKSSDFIASPDCAKN